MPYFKNKTLNQIKPADIIKWQNEMMDFRNEKDEGYSQTYLKTIQSQLSAILNHAVNVYDLPINPTKKVKSIGSSKSNATVFWTKKEFQNFKKKRNITEELKEQNQILWITEMNNIQDCIDEIIKKEIIEL